MFQVKDDIAPEKMIVNVSWKVLRRSQRADKSNQCRALQFCKAGVGFESRRPRHHVDLPHSKRHDRGVGIAESMTHSGHKNQETRMSTCIGQTIFVKGQLSASEDIQIAGRLEGDIQLNEHVLTVQPTAKLTAGVLAKSVVVQGDILGDIVAGLNITLQNTASVNGKISAPSIAISDGANFNGRIETSFPKA
jgi:cytoskeletal protein CcmA (bactofilin family)